MEERSRAMQIGGLVGIVAFPLVAVALLYYANRPEPDAAQVVRCGEAVQGRKAPIVQLSPEQCSAIAAAVPRTEVPDKGKVTQHYGFSPKVDVGQPPPADVSVLPLPAEIVEKFPRLQSYRYFVAGDDIALVEPSGERVVAFVEVHESPRAASRQLIRQTN